MKVLFRWYRLPIEKNVLYVEKKELTDRSYYSERTYIRRSEDTQDVIYVLCQGVNIYLSFFLFLHIYQWWVCWTTEKELEAGVGKWNNMGVRNIIWPTVEEIFLTFVGDLWFVHGSNTQRNKIARSGLIQKTPLFLLWA